jgi:hypothetical protein
MKPPLFLFLFLSAAVAARLGALRDGSCPRSNPGQPLRARRALIAAGELCLRPSPDLTEAAHASLPMEDSQNPLLVAGSQHVGMAACEREQRAR